MRFTTLILILAALTCAQAATLSQSLHSPNYDIDGQYGNALALMPDIDRDGIGELVVAAHREVANGLNWAGNVYVYHGGDFRLLYTLSAPEPEGTAMFGFSVTAIADVTGDSLSDLLVSSPFENVTGIADVGRVYLYNGATGHLVRTFQPPQLVARGYFGHSLANAGDIDNDGHCEILIGCVGQGKVFVYDGVTGTLKREYDPPIIDGCVSFGHVVAGMGDISGDGSPDYAAGAFCQGRAFTFNGGNGAIRDTLGGSILTDQGYGYSVAGLPDINHDGRADIMVGSPYANIDSVSMNSGKVYLISGADRTTIRELFAPIPLPDRWFGLTLAHAGDVDGDHATDVMIGSPNEGSGSDSLSGRVFVFNAVTGSLIDSIAAPNRQVQSNFGWALAGGIDITGDGRPDIVAASPYEDYMSTENAGGVYVFAYPVNTVPEPNRSIPTTTILADAYPNPFNAVTTIEYQIPVAGAVSITVTDLSGRVVTEAKNPNALAGENNRWQFNAKGLASGIYFYRVASGNMQVQKKIVFVK